MNWRPRIRRRPLVITGLVLAAFTSICWFLLGSTAGARFVLSQAIKKAPVGVSVVIERVEGKLLGPLALHDVRVGNPMVEVHVSHVEIDWSPKRLFNRHLYIERVAIDGVDARLLPPPPGGYPRKEAQSGSKPPPEMPLEITIAEARASGVKLLVTEEVEFRDLRVSLRGRPDRYELDFATRLVGEGMPEIGISAAATGTLADITVAPLDVRTLGGLLRARVGASWYPEVTWTVRASCDSIQPGLLAPDPARLPGRLAAKMRTEGRVDDGMPTGWATIDTLTGTLLERDVAGRARAEWRGAAVTSATASVRWATVLAELEAAVSDSLLADLSVSCADLGGVVPGLGGRANLAARMTGPRLSPRATATVLVEEITRQDPPLSIARVAGGLDLALADLDTTPTGQGRLRLRAETLQFGQVLLDSTVVAVEGTHLTQRARLLVDGEPLRARLEIGGSMDPAARLWTGAIDTLSIENPYAGRWALRESAHVQAGKAAAALDSLCLVHDGATLRLGGDWANGPWRAWGGLTGLPLSMADPHLPDEQHLRGTLGAEFAASGAGTELTGTVRAALADAWFVFVAVGNKPDSLAFETAVLTATAGPRDIAAKLEAVVFSPRSGGRAEMSGELSLPGGAVLPLAPETQAVRATITGSLPDLGLIDGLSPLVTDTRGSLALDAQVAGTVLEPQITGELRVRDMATTMPDLGITIETVDLTARGDVADGYSLEGSARSGEGALTVNGRIPPKLAPGTPLVVSLRGERFLGVNTPEVQIEVTPDLELVCDGARLDVRGTVVLPLVDVEMVEMPPTAVPPSADVIIVDAKASAPPPPIDTWVDVKVTLGDQVRFSGFAMSIDLEGGLEVKQHVPELPDCRGDVRIREGYYRAYGQNLDIERGVVSFVGPVDDPALDLKAFREAPDGVIAGVVITGSALAPHIKVYSEPVISETQAIAYLLTGRPLDAGTGDDKANVAATAALLGSNVLSSQLGAKVGLDEARIETGGSLEEAALVTGKYLTPELYLSYAMGLFDRSNLVRVRYIMSPKWAVQTETGTTMGADLFYKIERGGK
jgi:translocation and assembly module TamB